MNEHDSARIAQILNVCGMEPTREPDRADVIVINTCSVRMKPEQKAVSEACRYLSRKRHRKPIVIFAGCVAQQYGRRILERAPGLSAVMGPDAIPRLPEIIDSIRKKQTPFVDPVVDVDMHSVESPSFVHWLPDWKPNCISANVVVTKGCDNLCSYCIVPSVRGGETSRDQYDILREIEMLGKGGVREVVLLGQNVNSYRDPKTKTRFPDLLRAIDRQAAVDRIRFTTSHPKDLTEALIEAMAELPRVMEHLHLAVQSGSDTILQRMNRGYGQNRFIEIANLARNSVRDLSLTTDLIVGFPGETEGDFFHTLEIVRAVRFDNAFSFKYSQRPGTLAAGFPDDVAQDEKQRRLEILQELIRDIEQESLGRLVGRRLEVMTQGHSRRNSETYTGRTRCNRVVNFSSEQAIVPGTLISVEIVSSRSHTLWGHLSAV